MDISKSHDTVHAVLRPPRESVQVLVKALQESIARQTEEGSLYPEDIAVMRRAVMYLEQCAETSK